jgi:hypothetical protein
MKRPGMEWGAGEASS